MIEAQVSQTASHRPYAMVGAGELIASIWKSAQPSSDGQYEFNIFRLHRASGEVRQRFGPSDVPDLVKLAHILATILLDDGCLNDTTRHELRLLTAQLETLLPEWQVSDAP